MLQRVTHRLSFAGTSATATTSGRLDRRLNARNDRHICDLAAILAVQVIWTATQGNHAVFECLELYIVARPAGLESFLGVARGVLEDVESMPCSPAVNECLMPFVAFDLRISNLQIASHAIPLHDFGNVRCAASMVLDALLLEHLREAAHERHIMYFDSVLHNLQHRLVLVGP